MVVQEDIPMMELFRKSVNASREALAKVEVREELTYHYAIVRVYSKMLVTSCAIYTLLINERTLLSPNFPLKSILVHPDVQILVHLNFSSIESKIGAGHTIYWLYKTEQIPYIVLISITKTLR